MGTLRLGINEARDELDESALRRFFACLNDSKPKPLRIVKAFANGGGEFWMTKIRMPGRHQVLYVFVNIGAIARFHQGKRRRRSKLSVNIGFTTGIKCGFAAAGAWFDQFRPPSVL